MMKIKKIVIDDETYEACSMLAERVLSFVDEYGQVQLEKLENQIKENVLQKKIWFCLGILARREGGNFAFALDVIGLYREKKNHDYYTEKYKNEYEEIQRDLKKQGIIFGSELPKILAQHENAVVIGYDSYIKGRECFKGVQLIDKRLSPVFYDRCIQKMGVYQR